jgi:hypothetical protein
MPTIQHAAYRWIIETMVDLIRVGGNKREAIRIYMVGHSRGCVAAMRVANLLQREQLASDEGMPRPKELHGEIRVRFLGLYDAVQRDGDTAPDTRLENVETVYHARRENISIDPEKGSRGSFGTVEVSRARNLEFDTSHGGVGGDPGFFTRLDAFAADMYCNALRVVLNGDQLVSDYGTRAPGGGRLGDLGREMPEYRPLEGEALRRRVHALKGFLEESQGADAFIRRGAKAAGLQFSGASKHLPYSEKDAALWDRLQRILKGEDPIKVRNDQ